jgi:hypothetical protein
VPENPEFRFDATPNPNSLKITFGQSVGADRGKTYTAATAGEWPLAERLFQIPGIQSLFVLKDFVTVSKTGDAAWDSLVPEIEHALADHFAGENR